MEELPGWEGAALSETAVSCQLCPRIPEKWDTPSGEGSLSAVSGARANSWSGNEQPHLRSKATFRNRGAVKQHVASAGTRSALVC